MWYGLTTDTDTDTDTDTELSQSLADSYLKYGMTLWFDFALD